MKIQQDDWTPYNMPSDQVTQTVCAKFRVSFFLPTRGYRVLIAVNQWQMQDLLFLLAAGIVDPPKGFQGFSITPVPPQAG